MFILVKSIVPCLMPINYLYCICIVNELSTVPWEIIENFETVDDIRGLSQKFVDNMDNFVQKCGKSILRLLLFCPLY